MHRQKQGLGLRNQGSECRSPLLAMDNLTRRRKGTTWDGIQRFPGTRHLPPGFPQHPAPIWHLTPGTFFLPLLCFHTYRRMHRQKQGLGLRNRGSGCRSPLLAMDNLTRRRKGTTWDGIQRFPGTRHLPPGFPQHPAPTLAPDTWHLLSAVALFSYISPDAPSISTFFFPAAPLRVESRGWGVGNREPAFGPCACDWLDSGAAAVHAFLALTSLAYLWCFVKRNAKNSGE